MKRVVLGMILIAAPLFAQEETLISGKVEHGGFGGPVVKFTQMKDEFAMLVGGRGGWIINHTFVIGGGGYGLVSEIEADALSFTGEPLYLAVGYGGLELEYIASSNKLVHFSVPVLIGAGGIDYIERDFEDHHFDDHYFDGDVFFIAEPGINMILNVTSFFRLGVGGSYRFVSGVEIAPLENSDLSGPSAVVTLKFGKF